MQGTAVSHWSCAAQSSSFKTNRGLGIKLEHKGHFFVVEKQLKIVDSKKKQPVNKDTFPELSQPIFLRKGGIHMQCDHVKV